MDSSFFYSCNYPPLQIAPQGNFGIIPEAAQTGNGEAGEPYPLLESSLFLVGKSHLNGPHAGLLFCSTARATASARR